MADYGITPNGVNIKRLDEIEKEIHEYLSDGWGVNTRLNPDSLLSTLVTDFADKLAELWEFGAGIYWSMYPSTAEGVNLDNAAQFGGVLREGRSTSQYSIHCRGDEGTILAAGTMIRTDTSPVHDFVTTYDAEITCDNCNELYIKVKGAPARQAYTITINGKGYSGTPGTATVANILNNTLATLINGDAALDCTATYDSENQWLHLVNNDPNNNISVGLSTNLEPFEVVSIIQFSSVEFGDIEQPNNTITQIVTAVTGLKQVWNYGSYIAGRERETDVEFRRSYMDKIFGLGERMIESISAELLSLPGVNSAKTYENLTDYYDLTYSWLGNEGAGPFYFEIDGIYVVFTPPSPQAGDSLTYYTGQRGVMSIKRGTGNPVEFNVTSLSVNPPTSGREITFIADVYPHSVEAIVYGGEDNVIANAIFDLKAGGISTSGNHSVTIYDTYQNPQVVRFSRPVPVYTWFKVNVTIGNAQEFPNNGNQLITDIIVQNVKKLLPGESVRPQEWMTELYDKVSGVMYYDIKIAAKPNESTPSPSEYTMNAMALDRRQLAVTGAEHITITQS